ncbi:hypothetical protein [uncultured Prevotella sp.]|uniref:hypothetical protein n=1 Tax=uncultured Prevotella sp. TaxID=159272 RepID=UPI002586B6B3|nr:hypothetical protein [uncultured Prevotella sp.]
MSDISSYGFNYDNGTTKTTKTFTEAEDYQRYLGKYFCADVKNVRGIIYQDVEIKNNGVYVVECKGYSNTKKAKLFATIVTMGADGKWTDTGDGQIRTTVLSQISYMPAAEQTALHTSEKNMDYAGQEFYNSRKYINNVLVNVEGLTIPTERQSASVSWWVVKMTQLHWMASGQYSTTSACSSPTWLPTRTSFWMKTATT